MEALFKNNTIWNTAFEIETVDYSLQTRFGKTYHTVTLITAVLVILISILAVPCNMAVIFFFVRDPLKILRMSPSSYLVFSLACGEFLTTVSINPLAGVGLVYVSQGEQIPFALSAVLICNEIMRVKSVIILIVLSIDRLIAVLKPLQYKHIVTVKRTLTVIAAVWVYTILLGFTLVVLYNMVGVASVLIVAVCHIILASCTLKLSSVAFLWSLRKQSLILRKLYNRDGTQNKHALLRERKVTKGVRIIIFSFHLLFMPWCCCLVLMFACLRCDINVFAFSLAFLITMVINFSSSLVHPFLYAFGLPKFKKTFKHLVKKSN